MAMQVNSYNSSMAQYRARMNQAPRVTDAAAPTAQSTQSTQSNQNPAMQSLKNLNLSQEQLNTMVSGGRIMGGAGLGGVLLGFLCPPLHFLVAVGFLATALGFGASVVGDALGGKG